MAGRRDPSEYTFVVAEVSWDPRKKEGRLSPIAGEAFPQDMYIECSKMLRALPPTTKVRLKVVVKNPKSEDHSHHLYTSYKWGYEVIG